MEPDKLNSLLKDIENLRVKIDSIQCEHPYRLNVIDELHINENGHSRILAKLLQYRSDKGKYIFLESLLRYINNSSKKNVVFPDHVINPIITQETERIDLWVRDDKNFALIIENKACGAMDQDRQLYRYIIRTIDYGFDKEQIFVIYLPPMEDSAPSDVSWNGLEEDFKGRFVPLSFRTDIIN